MSSTQHRFIQMLIEIALTCFGSSLQNVGFVQFKKLRIQIATQMLQLGRQCS